MRMQRTARFGAWFAVFVAGCGGGGSSGSGSGVGSGDELSCRVPAGTPPICYIVKDLTTQQLLSAAMSGCIHQTGHPGTIVSSCSTSGLTGGCCTVTEPGPDPVPLETCVYSGTAEEEQAACTLEQGTWSAGP
jgi:hypothetical protein